MITKSSQRGVSPQRAVLLSSTFPCRKTESCSEPMNQVVPPLVCPSFFVYQDRLFQRSVELVLDVPVPQMMNRWWKCRRLCLKTESSSELPSRSWTLPFRTYWRSSWRYSRFSPRTGSNSVCRSRSSKSPPSHSRRRSSGCIKIHTQDRIIKVPKITQKVVSIHVQHVGNTVEPIIWEKINNVTRGVWFEVDLFACVNLLPQNLAVDCLGSRPRPP